MEEGRHPASFENYAYDIRDNRIYRYQRLTKYLLLQSIPGNKLAKISPDEFDQFFEGMPVPEEPFLKFIR